MAMHTELSIYKAASGLLQMATNLTRNIPRELKQSLGAGLSMSALTCSSSSPGQTQRATSVRT